MEIKDVQILKLTQNQIDEKRNQIRNEFIKQSENIKSGTIKAISNKDLQLLFNLYDKIYFNYLFRDNIKNLPKLSLSKRMSRNAGKTIMKKSFNDSNQTYEIVMAVKFFFNYDSLTRDKKVNGINSADALNALQLVFEHEICHLLEFNFFNVSNCKGQRFKTLAFNIFGHTDVYHQLPTESEIANKNYGFKLGNKVHFEAQGKLYTGVINSINKRATVMVPSPRGDYRDKAGNRYSKWYIPLSNLKLVK